MRILKIALITLGVILGLGIITLISTYNKVENYELGYTFDLRTGKIDTLPRTGYFFTWPIIVKVHTIDLRPTQVCINANSRVLNCKLVKFNPKGLQEFIAWHGRDNYYIDISTSTTTFEDILMSYAYDESGEKYPFITIVKEFGSNNSVITDTTKTTQIDTTQTK